MEAAAHTRSWRRWVGDRAQRVSLATRVSLLTTAAVGVTLAFVSAIIYVSVESEFTSSVDENLKLRAAAAVRAGIADQLNSGSFPKAALAAADVQMALIYAGAPSRDFGDFIGPDEEAVAEGRVSHSLRTATIGGVHYRVVAVGAAPGTALVVGQSMANMETALSRLQVVLWAVSGFGVLVAGLLGSVVATGGLRPVRRLTTAVEQVARTEDLRPIAVYGHDDLARLTVAYNQMMVALKGSQERQRQLVADAGHELRTPLTSLRTNIELLGQAEQRGGMSRRARQELIDDVRAQLDELTTLVGDLVELARDPGDPDPEPIDLAEVVETAVDRVQRRAPGVAFEVSTEPWIVIGESRTLERAVTNLRDNAAEWSPPLGEVQVRLKDGVLTVQDAGPGISDEDLPHVFDRFYRSREARRLPGSGLGLAIVAQAAHRHGGTVTASRGPGGGALMTLHIPGRRGDGDQDRSTSAER
ncbi:HAMP domain-containing sensor histidine kinase [Mumia sp.]|uniref:sensor histidine kinase n=1 Tax=Mumia sp. TaxID=1965300 RepID=UPI002637C8E1|nr:HAMP domain-containing sensor histidine kinase [Mumia sp.]MDD9348018.1 HAMP domain-containing sensor histidine kinase [Mumia sp.]